MHVHMQDTLTAKQENFCQAIADGLNQTEAYQSAYNAGGMLIKSIYEQASILAADIKVAARIADLKASVATNRAWDRERFINEAETNLTMARDLGQIAPANGSLSLIGKATGIIQDKETASPDTAIDAIIKLASALSEAELRKRALPESISQSIVDIGPDSGDSGEIIEGESRQIE